MAFYMASEEELRSIADAIRERGGTEVNLVFPADFVSAIEAIGDPFDPLAKAVTITGANQSVIGPSSSSTPGTARASVMLNPAYVYIFIFERASITAAITSSTTVSFKTYVHDGTEWTTASNNATSWATATLDGNRLDFTITASRGYFVRSRGFYVAQVHSTT